mgnify:CR=1 FL=1
MPWVNILNGNIQSITKDRITTETFDGEYEIDRDLVDLEYVVIEGDSAVIKHVADEEIAAIDAATNATLYKRLRVQDYPRIQEQFDMQYHDAVDGTTTWKDAIQAIKDAHPKP